MATLPMGSSMIVERHLGSLSGPIDCSVCITREDSAGAAIAGLDSERTVPAAWFQQSTWTRLREFLGDWVAPDSHSHREVQSVWLEFDKAQLSSGRLLPSVFIDMRKASSQSRRILLRSASKTFADTGTIGTLPELLEEIVVEGSPEASVEFVGFMMPRNPTTCRFCLRLPSRDPRPFLARFGISLDPGHSDLISRCFPSTRKMVLHLDMANGLMPSVGLELHPNPSGDWKSLLNVLRRADLCTKSERDALLTFSGRSGMCRGDGMLSASSRFSVRAPSHWKDVAAWILVHRVNHVKLVFHPGRPPIAKAYLYLGAVWLHRLQQIQLCPPRSAETAGR